MVICAVVGAVGVGIGCQKAEGPQAPSVGAAGAAGAAGAPGSGSAKAPPAPLAPPAGPRLVVDAAGVRFDGAAWGPQPSAAQLATLPPDMAAIAFTADAPARSVLDVTAALQGAGRARVELALLAAPGAPKVVCSAAAAPTGTAAVQLELGAKDELELGLEDAIPVFRHDRVTGAPIDIELDTPFFADAPALALATDPAATAGALAALLELVCPRRSAIRVLPAPAAGPPGPPVHRTLPLCRKLQSKSTFDAEQLREAMPSLYAMDLCYRKFEPRQGPRGTATLTFDIEPSGKLANTAAKGLHPDVNRCLAWLLRTVQVASPPAARTRAVVTAECNTRCCNGD